MQKLINNWQGLLMWFGIILIIFLLFGCASNKQTPNNEWDDQRFFDLLHLEQNIVRKSITIKDYTIKEEC
jgi:uncharacterized protein YcfL